jgi:hypothetical protein
VTTLLSYLLIKKHKGAFYLPQFFLVCSEQPPEQPGQELFFMLLIDLYAPKPISPKKIVPTMIVGNIYITP